MNINDSAKTVVCYGDSNTWGRVPRAGRYPRTIRWTGVLQRLLGEDYEVISEGVGGRTFVAEDKENPYRTGIIHLKSILRTSIPIDLIVIMLGTNDIKDTFKLTAEDISKHLEQTIALIKTEDVKEILIVCPPEIVVPDDNNLDPRYVGGSEILKRLPILFEKVSDEHKCHFLNAGDYISSSKIDGFHLDPDMHQKLAEVLRDKILQIFKII